MQLPLDTSPACKLCCNKSMSPTTLNMPNTQMMFDFLRFTQRQSSVKAATEPDYATAGQGCGTAMMMIHWTPSKHFATALLRDLK